MPKHTITGTSTAETILDSVTGVFAEKGYNGARVDELAKAAGVNKATLYYQIGDKEALYHAVLEREFRHIADTIEQAVLASSDCEEQIRNFISTFAARIQESGHIAQLMLGEIVSGGSHAPDAALAQMGRVLSLLTNALQQGIASQHFRPINPFMLHMMIVGSLNLYAVNEPIRRRVIASRPELSSGSHKIDISIREAGEEVADLVLAAIRTTEQRQ
jgi:TetR/AcrR family transcriptional regulator